MATIVCDAEKVKAAAGAVIKAILQKRSELDEAKIVKTMGKRRMGWKGFYFPSREEAIKILNEGSMFGWRSKIYWGTLAHAEKLRILATHGNPVTLNEEDTRVLFG